MKIMVWNAARGGMRSVVEGYIADGFIAEQAFRLIQSYADGNIVVRQLVLAKALVLYVWLLLTRRIDLVHCHVAMKGSFWRKTIFARLAAARGIPVVFHLHGSEMKPFFERQPAPIKAAIVAQLERATSVVVLSLSWSDFVSMIAPRASVTIVPNYVAIPAAVARPEKQTPSLLFLGAVGHRKGIFDLLKALAEARRTQPDLRLVVGGDGQLDEAKAMAVDLGIADHVDFVGWVNAARRAELLREAGLFVLPSYNEGLPMSVLEAMAAGLCVVTTDVGGLPELIVNGATGIMIKPGDTTALARALAEIASDPERRKRIGDAARERVQQAYSREVALAILASIYESAVGPVDDASTAQRSAA